MDDELAFHVEMRVRELIAAGESPESARQKALERFGDAAAARAECVTISKRRGRRMKRADYASELMQDVAYAFRSLRQRPAFTAVAVLTLALGIGANSAIFSVVNGVLLKSLPFADADRLYRLEMVYPDGQQYASLSAPDFMSVVEQNRVFEAVGSYEAGSAPLLGLGEPRDVRGVLVSDGLFGMLGMPLMLGRGFTADEHQPGRNDVAVLDHGFWQSEFGGATDAIGRSFTYFGRTVSVVGVLAPDAVLPWRADVYLPQPYDELFSATAAEGRRSEFLTVYGRARPGLAAEQVDADVRRVSAQLAAEFPASNDRLSMAAVPLRETIVGDVRGPLLVLLGAVGFVLLVACANVANLLLARASARQSELALRAALGAGRGRLVRQLLTEASVLGLAGGAAGLLIAYVGTRALVRAQPADIPRLDAVGVDGTVVFVTLGLALLTGLLFGALPAFQATAGQLGGALREGARGLQSGAGKRIRTGLIIAEMGLAVVLLVGAGLLIRSFVELTRVDPGFRADGAMAFRIAVDQTTFAEMEQVRAFVGGLLERVNAVPGVVSAAGTRVLPLSGRGSLINFSVVGAPPPPDNVNQEIGYYSVTPGYATTIGARIVAGRDFTAQDRTDAPPVALINEAGARFWFPGEDPVGRRVVIGPGEREIVGVMTDVLQRDPRTPPRPQLFAPYEQQSGRSVHIVVRTAGDPVALAPALRTLIRSMGPTVTIGEFRPLEQVVAATMARPRFYTSLLTLFAAVALTLAAVGIFGVMSYLVAQRSREISIRMALGADAGRVTRMIVGSAMKVAAAGLVVGFGCAIAVGGVLRSQLYGVGVTDPVTLAGVLALLAASAAVASYIPARRAARLEPGAALKG